MYKPRLFAPGPVEVPPQVLEAMARPTTHHRTPEFKELFLRVREKLAELCCVPGEDVRILAGSGTSAFEAGFLASVPKGSKILGINAGKFGERWVKLARTFGYGVTDLQFDWGKVAEPAMVRQALEQNPDISVVMTTHSETSTGALHDVQALARAIREVRPEALILVDCVTSLSATEVRPKEWGLDGVFSGSQKGLMLPPGLGFAWLSERAWAQQDLSPSFYLDLRKERKSQVKGETAYTPAVNLIYGLEASLDMLLNEGIEQVWQRRAKFNEAIMAAGKAVGCKPYAERPSPAVAALYAPEGIAAPDIVKGFTKRGMRIAGGQDHAKAVMFRPSALGYADAFDVISIAAALEASLRDLGQAIAQGSAVVAAMQVLEG